jgi:glycosyltransferase involved in cell wall biosynthesis
LYPIDIEAWKPIERNLARDLLGLPRDVPLLLFGAMGGGRDPRKGFDLLTAALERLSGKVFGLELVVFGQLAPQNPPDLGYPVHYVGHLHDDLSLRTLYSAANAFALPSRQDNLPLTCMESLACGTPVIAFDASGAPTMIKHKETGFLAKAFYSQDFADGIEWVVSHSDPIALSSRTRDLAVQQFQPSLIAQQYLDVYSKASAF